MPDQDKPFSHTDHMRDMFWLYMRTGDGSRLRQGTVSLNDLYAIYCAGFTEGTWTERAHPAAAQPRKPRPPAKPSR
jgi:hypothetical protein